MDEVAGFSFDVVVYAVLQEFIAVNVAERRGQLWIILVSMCTSGKVRSISLSRVVRSSSGAFGSSRSALTPCWVFGPVSGL